MARSEVGEVTSIKMTNTVIVKVESKTKHPLYKKLIKKTRRFKAHDDIGVKLGQKVRIIETKKYSKDVHFKILEVLD